MIKTPLSTMIGGAGIWTPGCTVIGSMQKTLGQLIKSMFSNSEQGFAYDFNDLSTLFQDAAGTTPVTAAGQPMGLVLDKSKGLVLGAEFVTNNWNLAGLSDWIYSNGILTKSSITASGGPSQANTSPFVAGRLYRVEYEVLSISGGLVGIQFVGGTSKSTAYKGSVGKYIEYVFANAGNNYLRVVANANTALFSVKVISVKELVGNHAYQTISASRPILSDRVNVFYDSTPTTTGRSWGLLQTTLSYPSVQTPHGVKNVALVTRTGAGVGYISSKPLAVLPALSRKLVFSAIVKGNNATYANIRLQEAYPARLDASFNLSTGTVDYVGNAGTAFTNHTADIKNLGDGWYYIALSGITSTSKSNTGHISFGSLPLQIDGNEPTTTAAGYVYGGDLRAYSASSPVALPLTQEVEYGITKTKGFPNYLLFDGVDDFLYTSAIDFTATDKVSLFAGVRKLSDAAISVVAELSATVNENTGAFRLTSGNMYQYISKGSAANLAGVSATSASLAAPHSAVISAKSNINADVSTLRVNGSSIGASAADQGTGNYGNYPLYIGRRGGSTLPFKGHLYSLIGVGRLTTDSETIALEKSIAKNVGVTL